MPEAYYYKSTNLVRVRGLYDRISASYLNAATVTCRVLAKQGHSPIPGGEITGETFPVSLPYVAASDGVYQGTVHQDLAVVLDERYWLEVTAVDSGNQRYWLLDLNVTAEEER
jgi:hypothetical protein